MGTNNAPSSKKKGTGKQERVPAAVSDASAVSCAAKHGESAAKVSPSKAHRSAKIKRDPKPAGEPTAAQRKQRTKEKLGHGAKIALVAVGVAAMLLSVTAMACSGVLNQAANTTDYALTGGVAATVNGVNIKEDTITKQAMSTRESLGYTEDADWAKYLSDQGLTPESYRESLIRSYASQYLLTAAEKEYNVTVTNDDVQKAWDDAVASYGGDEKAFLELMGQMGFDEASYKESLKSQLAQQKLKEAVAPAKDPSDEELIAYVNENLATYNDARRSSHILIKVDADASEEDAAKAQARAQEALDKVNSGELSFEDAAKEYSEDTSKDDGGDVGWDKLTTFVTEYQDALNGLAKDQVSGLVKSTYGWHIIKCTDLFHVDGEVTSTDQVPKALLETFTTTIKNNQVSADYSTWLSDYTEKADIQINEMPQDVPYNVDMKLAEQAAAEGDAGSAESGSAE